MASTDNTATASTVTDNAVAEIPPRTEVTRTLNMLKLSVSELYTDAARRAPYFSKSKQEATAKLTSALKVIEDFSNKLDSIKKG
jgi:hypothetical protein